MNQEQLSAYLKYFWMAEAATTGSIDWTSALQDATPDIHERHPLAPELDEAYRASKASLSPRAPSGGRAETICPMVEVAPDLQIEFLDGQLTGGPQITGSDTTVMFAPPYGAGFAIANVLCVLQDGHPQHAEIKGISSSGAPHELGTSLVRIVPTRPWGGFMATILGTDAYQGQQSQERALRIVGNPILAALSGYYGSQATPEPDLVAETVIGQYSMGTNADVVLRQVADALDVAGQAYDAARALNKFTSNAKYLRQAGKAAGLTKVMLGIHGAKKVGDSFKPSVKLAAQLKEYVAEFAEGRGPRPTTGPDLNPFTPAELALDVFQYVVEASAAGEVGPVVLVGYGEGAYAAVAAANILSLVNIGVDEIVGIDPRSWARIDFATMESVYQASTSVLEMGKDLYDAVRGKVGAAWPVVPFALDTAETLTKLLGSLALDRSDFIRPQPGSNVGMVRQIWAKDWQPGVLPPSDTEAGFAWRLPPFKVTATPEVGFGLIPAGGARGRSHQFSTTAREYWFNVLGGSTRLNEKFRVREGDMLELGVQCATVWAAGNTQATPLNANLAMLRDPTYLRRAQDVLMQAYRSTLTGGGETSARQRENALSEILDARLDALAEALHGAPHARVPKGAGKK